MANWILSRVKNPLAFNLGPLSRREKSLLNRYLLSLNEVERKAENKLRGLEVKSGLLGVGEQQRDTGQARTTPRPAKPWGELSDSERAPIVIGWLSDPSIRS